MTLVRPLAALAAASLLLLAGCATSRSAGAGEDAPEEDQESGPTEMDSFSKTASRQRSEASVSVRYATTAQANWVRAEDAFKDENYLGAQKYYTYIRNKFPYTALAVQAELRYGDCLVARGRNLEAIDAFQNFVRLHPTHRQVGYAMYKTGYAYHEQIPTDWFILPPSYEKDQGAVRDAERALRAFVERYPNDPNIADGKRLLADTRKRLIAHERYAADFYRRLDKPKAVIGRLEVIHGQYGDIGTDDALLLELAELYARVNDAEKLKATVAELATKFPQSPKRKAAEGLTVSAAAKS